MKKPKRILILGPESTGKSTLAEDLANHFGEPWVPEYAREYLEQINRPYQFKDLAEIGKGQVALEDKLAEKAKISSSAIQICGLSTFGLNTGLGKQLLGCWRKYPGDNMT